MAIRIQFAGDKSIGVGSRPPGAFSLFKPPGAAFPPAGSYNSTLYGYSYPQAQGGETFYFPITATDFPSQKGDVDVLNDGSGGTYIDWSSITNIVYKDSSDPAFYNDGTAGSTDIYIGELGASFNAFSWSSTNYVHDGTGSYATYYVGLQYQTSGYSYGVATGLQYDYPAIEVPSASGNYFSPAFSPDTECFADGAGSYYIGASGGTTYNTGVITTGANYQTEVPSMSGNYFDNGTYPSYEWDGTGGYTTQTGGSYYAYGDFITNYGGTDYYWDGSGGYYS